MRDKSVLTVYLVSCIAVTVISYLVIESGFYSISVDESTRTLMAYQWFKNGTIENTCWLPLHFIILGLGFFFSQNLFITPRVISILAGLGVIAATGLITWNLFRNMRTLLIAIILAAMLPQRLILSLIPLPEIIYILFICLGAVFVYRYLVSSAIREILLASLFWSIAGLLRYESWLFLLVLSGFIFLRYLKKQIGTGQLLLLIFAIGAVPMFWIMLNYLSTGHWFYFLHEPASEFSQLYNSGNVDLGFVNPLYQFFNQNLMSLNLLGITGLYLAGKNKGMITWSLIIFLPLFLLSGVSLTGKALPAHNFWRIAAVWSVLLVPFTAFTITIVTGYIVKGRKIIQAVIIVLVLLQFSLNSYAFIKLNAQRYTFNQADMLTGKYLLGYINSENRNDSRVLIETLPSYEQFNVTLGSEDPFRFIFSEPDTLEPVRKEKYINTPIDYYLVKSYSMVRQLKRSQMKEVLHFNNWTLFKKTD